MAEWGDYRYFLALAKAGTLAAAARELGVEHTTVSRRIAALEAALGTKLFVRTPDGFVLTRAGTEALPQLELAAASIEAVERRIAGGDHELKGVVRLTTSEGFSGFLVQRLGKLREQHPEIVVEVLTGNQVYDLTRWEADLAVRIAPTPHPELLTRKIGDVGWALYAATTYLERVGAPTCAADLMTHDILAYDEAHAQYPGAQWLDANVRGARVVMRGNSIVSVLSAALGGLGVGSVPCFLGDAEPTLRRVLPEVVGTKAVSLVVHNELASVARVRAVMDFVIAMTTAEAVLLRGHA